MRSLTLFIGIFLILSLAIAAIASLYQLYASVALTAPFLANLLLLLILAMLVGAIGGFVYFAYQYFERQENKQASKPPPKAPTDKTAAAVETLNVVRQQLDGIHDRVARETLEARSQTLSETITRREFRVVIFGTGSSGKTSLVNATIGRVTGEVSAPMGTTQAGETYTLKMPECDREIALIDTPGILEAGEEGSQREQLARQLAIEGDLLVFVVDNDLRHSEYVPLRRLAQMGKRSLVVFNKIDLYADDDRELILAKLRDRLADFIGAGEIVAVAANPQPWRLETGETIHPDPDALPFIRRLAAILRAEGEDLIADNILLQSQRLGDEARDLLDRQRRRQADKIIDRYQWIGAGVIAATPLPVVDMVATAAVNAQMVVEIGKVYGCELNLDRGRELAFSLGKTLVSLGVVKGAMQLVSTALQFSLGAYVFGKAIQGVTAAYLTRIAGKSFIEYFRQNQDWGDGGMVEVVKRQFQLNRRDEFVKAFVSEAIEKVVKPLREQEPTDDRPEPPAPTPEPLTLDDWQEENWRRQRDREHW